MSRIKTSNKKGRFFLTYSFTNKYSFSPFLCHCSLSLSLSLSVRRPFSFFLSLSLSNELPVLWLKQKSHQQLSQITNTYVCGTMYQKKHLYTPSIFLSLPKKNPQSFSVSSIRSFWHPNHCVHSFSHKYYNTLFYLETSHPQLLINKH